MEVPQTTKNRIAIWSSNPTPGHISRQNCNLKTYMHPMFIEALFTITEPWKQTSFNRWIKKMWCIYIRMYIYTMEYYSVIKKNEIMPFAAAWMELGIIILSEVSQKEKDKYHKDRYHLYMESKTWHERTCLQNRNRLTDVQNRLTVAKGSWGRDALGVWG